MALMEHLEAVRPIFIGFHIPAWISPFVKLADIASIACSCALSDDRMEKKDLQNNFKAEPWEEAFETRTEDALLALCDDRPRGIVPSPTLLPDGRSLSRVSCLLAAVDTQLRYFRYVIRAFGYGDDAESWLVQEGVAPSLAALDELFWKSEYHDAAGTAYKVRAVMIDAMGHPERTAAVYAWAAKNRERVFPSQGVHSPASPISYAPQEYFPGMKGERLKIPGGILLHRVDTTLFKGMLAAKLSIQAGDPGAFYLHASDKESLLAYAKEMCAEVWNAEKNMWDNPHGRPNHAFDCEYYLQALAWMLHVSKARRPEEKQAATQHQPKAQTQSIRTRPQPAILGRGAADVLAGLRRS
ncbi:MAG: phage terminase large subunit family protein [Desulfovibrionaceae bacterium]|nr:phage terminase large subunit family protein [Desulfovibrionaceae bacterium]